MWLAQNWVEVCGEHTPAGLANPSELRRWFNEQQEATRPLPFLRPSGPADLDLEASEVAASGEAADIARAVPGHRKVSKLQAHVERGGFEGANAQRSDQRSVQLDKMAERLGMETEKKKNKGPKAPVLVPLPPSAPALSAGTSGWRSAL
jgi:hypothetical protein